MSPTPEITLRELDSRTNDGIEVWLLWNRVTNAVSIVVADERAGKSFELEVDPAEALTAFHHPYAYPDRRRSGLTPSPDVLRAQPTP
jgi:hypothetical protein